MLTVHTGLTVVGGGADPLYAYNGHYTVLVQKHVITRRKKTHFDVSCTLPLGQNNLKPGVQGGPAGRLEYGMKCAPSALCKSLGF